MCFDAASSLRTFSFATIIALFLIWRNYPADRVIGFTWLAVSAMQLAEYYMWKNQDCNSINRIASISAVLILILQPLALIASIYYFGDSVLSKTILKKATIVALIVAVGASIYSIYRMSNQKTICTLPGKQGYLDWDLNAFSGKNKTPLLLALIFGLYYWGSSIFLFTLKPLSQGIIYFLMFTLSLLFSFAFTNYADKEWKSFWCWLINYMLVIPLIIGYLVNKKITF